MTASAPQGEPLTAVEAVRRFSRFYTRRIGVLQEGLHRSPFSLTEARVIYELAQRERSTASELAEALALDAGYLSRMLRGFQERGLVARTPSTTDGRQQHLALTESGTGAFAELDTAARREAEAMLGRLPPGQQRRLVAAMRTVEQLLGGPTEPRAPYILRPHQPGDLGWVVQRHGVLYSQEYGWDARFEGLVARVVADFVDRFDPARERCWIAERAGERVGSVFLVRHPERDGVAKLRLLLVEPSARGLGIGRRLVAECTRFARAAGYHAITLWTNNVLVAARQIYAREGYQLVREERHNSFGQDLVAETWELRLE